MLTAPSRAHLLRLLGALVLSLSACSERGEDSAKAPAAGSHKALAAESAAPELASFALTYKAGPSEALIQDAQDAVRQSPKDAGGYRSLAEAFLVRKRETANAKYFALAKDAMAAAQSLRPNDIGIRTSAVQLLFTDHRFKEAAAETRKIIATNANNATAHLLLSDALVEEGDYDGAVIALESAMEIEPDMRVYSRGSYLRWLDGDLEGAIEFMEDAIKLGSATNEAVSWCLVELGMLQWHAGALDKAEAVANKAQSLVPEYAAATELLARIEASRGNSDKAITLYASLVAQRPTVAAHIALSELLEAAGQAGKALVERKKAEAMAVHDPLALALHDARHGLHPEVTLKLATRARSERSNLYTQDAHALALLRVGKLEEAKKASPPLTRYGSLDSRLWLHRGLIQAATADLAAAQASLDKALAINRYVDPKLVAELRATLTKEVPQ